MKKSNLTALIVALCIAGSHVACAQTGPATAPDRAPLNEPLHERFTTDAWTNFHAGQYAAAITNSDLCIARFGEAANRSQAILESEKVTLPTGAVSPADKERIGRYQILHDVATCFLLKGWAEEKLGHKEAARKAYAEAKKYTYARSSRPAGEVFWSPAEKASEALTK